MQNKMQNNFQKYRHIIQLLISEHDVNTYVLSHSLDGHGINFIEVIESANPKDKVKTFFDHFEKIDDENKYEILLQLTKETSEWIRVLLIDSEEHRNDLQNFDIALSMLHIQRGDHIQALCLDEGILYQCRNDGLINELQFSELMALIANGRTNMARINFLLKVCRKSKDWFGKLLCVYHRTQCDFIPTYLLDLDKDLKEIKSDKEKEEFICAYGNSLIERQKKYGNDNGAGQSSIETEMDDIQKRFVLLNSLLTDDFQDTKKLSENWKIALDLLKIQREDYIQSLYMDDYVLFKSREIGLLTHNQCEELLAYDKSYGEDNVKIKFLLQICNNDGWYGKLLYILYDIKCDFISRHLGDLQKELDAFKSEEKKKQRILVYGNDIIEKNLKDFPKNRKPIQNHSKIEMDFLYSPSSSIQLGFPTSSFQTITNSANSSLTNGLLDIRKEDFGDGSDDSSNSDDDDINNPEMFNSLFGQLKDKSVKELLHFNVNVDKTPSSDKSLVMREYQKELAEQGIRGNNVLICSPTGSGKTIVAVKIVQDHLKNNSKGKVAFLVHRIALVEQQYTQFSHYLDYRITRLSGSAKSSGTPLIGHLESFDVFVLTSDILRNALEEENETKLESINQFSLILFDECHNCDKKHPYNRIMTHYFKEKKAGHLVPQIIGLTASTGTNKAKTMDKALKRLYTLCANLDTYIVSTVELFKDELEKNQSRPVEEIFTPPQKSPDKFDTELQMLMALCENMLHQMNARDYFPKDSNTQAMFNIPEDRLHQKYQGFVGKLSTELYNKTKEMNDGRKALFAISSYLNAFVRALMVNHLFRAMDAVKLIQDALGLTNKNPFTCKVEKILRNKLSKLSDYTTDKLENPSLTCLKEKIENQIQEDPTSRIIVFVRERNYTQILKNIFASELPSLKCETVVGNTISAEQGGLTQNEMEEVLGRFRKGEVTVLFATTVAEEGLDIQKCNLVIRYGHVTNETAMVQSRGRARAANSKYIVIVPYKLQWQVNKENINKYRETMMYRAIAKFQQMDKEEIKRQIEDCQYERELQETCVRLNQTSISRPLSSEIWQFNCKKCSQPICKSSDIRIAEGAHHIVIHEKCFKFMSVAMAANQTSCQIKCKVCKSLLGNRQNYKSRLFPTLKIDCFSVICEGMTQSRTFKKWRDVPFAIAQCTNAELLDFKQNHELAI